MADIIVFGTGQISEVVRFYLEQDTDHQVLGFTVDRDFMTTDRHNGLPVVPFDALESYYAPDRVRLIIPISFKGLNKYRKARYLEAKQRGYAFISYISSKATYYGTPVGENTIIFEDNTIQPFTEIGNNVVMWSGNHLGHHSKIEDHSFLTSHVVVSGAVTIGEQSFIGVNSTIHDNVRIGRECVIGAGSIVAKDLADYSVVRPAKSNISDVKSYDLKGF